MPLWKTGKCNQPCPMERLRPGSVAVRKTGLLGALGRPKHIRTKRMLSSRQDDLVAFLERDNGLFPIRRLSGLMRALPAKFAPHVHGVDAEDLDFEQFLHGLFNLVLIGAAIHYQGVLIVLLALPRPFFREAHSFDDLKAVHGQFFNEHPAKAGAMRVTIPPGAFAPPFQRQLA